MYWAASCGGCEIAVLNIHEKILDVDANFDVVFWPVAMDAKYKDVEAHGRWLDHCSPVQRRHPQRRERAHRAPAAPESPRSWSRSVPAPAKAASPAWQTCLRRSEIFDTAFTHRLDRQPEQHPPADRIPRCPKASCTIPTLQPGAQDARPGRGCGLLHARLPARSRTRSRR
ncbi:MAG: hypothetical protein MZV49_25315 [Rhodopseudomonas palustris]|nr:hypothetical protein [Rhodopseudomonas palustris]